MQNPKPPHKRKRNQQPTRRTAQRNRRRTPLRNRAPQDRPQRHPALKRHHVSPQRPRLHPSRHRKLHTHIDRRHRARPRRPAQHQRRNNHRTDSAQTPAPAAPPRYTASSPSISGPPNSAARTLCSIVAAITAPSPSDPFKMPYPSGPCFKSCFATTASSDHIAEMKNGNDKRPHQRSLQIRRIPHIPQPRPDRSRNPLRRQRRLEQRHPLPVHQHPDHARKRNRIQRKHAPRARLCSLETPPPSIRPAPAPPRAPDYCSPHSNSPSPESSPAAPAPAQSPATPDYSSPTRYSAET